jgi:hypothetical protein
MNIELIKSVGTLKSRVTNLWMNILKISLYNLMAYGRDSKYFQDII